MDPNKHYNALDQDAHLHWYQVKSILGQGGFGITYLAYDTNLKQQVAIKEYLPSEFSTRDASNTVQPLSEEHGEIFSWGLQRFLEEAQTLAKFKHPNIVRVQSFFEENNTAYMVMEYEEGEDLAELIRQGEYFSEDRLLDIFMPILDGLEKVHASGFIHRDIKPANIFIRKDGSPVLIDFGSARHAIGGHTRTMTSLVTPGFAPFEQYDDSETKQGPWTDIYALGATLYCTITGKPPVDSIKRGIAQFQHNTDAYLELADLKVDKYPGHFLRAIDCALRFNDQERPQSTGDWKKMLLGEMDVPEVSAPETSAYTETLIPEPETAATVRVTDAEPKTPVVETDRGAATRPGRSWMLLVIVMGALLLGLGGWAVLFEQPTRQPAGYEQETDLSREELQAELDRKQAELEQAEREREAEVARLEAEKQKMADEARLKREQEEARKAEEARQRKLVEQKAAQEQARQAAEKKKQEEAVRKAAQEKELAEKRKQEALARQQAEKQRLANRQEILLLLQSAEHRVETGEIDQAENEFQRVLQLNPEAAEKSRAEQGLEMVKQARIDIAEYSLIAQEALADASESRFPRDITGQYISIITSNHVWYFRKGGITKIYLDLEQRGDVIVGTDGTGRAQVNGRRNGNTIKFTFWSPDWGSYEYKGEWYIRGNSRTLEGKWHHPTHDADGKWDLEKIE